MTSYKFGSPHLEVASASTGNDELSPVNARNLGSVTDDPAPNTASPHPTPVRAGIPFLGKVIDGKVHYIASLDTVRAENEWDLEFGGES